MAPMDTWFREIERATTEDEVVAQARDYCVLLHPRDLAGLPDDIKAIRIEGSEDIPRLRERLEACGAARDRAFDGRKIGDLMDYLSRASARLGEIAPRH